MRVRLLEQEKKSRVVDRKRMAMNGFEEVGMWLGAGTETQNVKERHTQSKLEF